MTMRLILLLVALAVSVDLYLDGWPPKVPETSLSQQDPMSCRLQLSTS